MADLRQVSREVEKGVERRHYRWPGVASQAKLAKTARNIRVRHFAAAAGGGAGVEDGAAVDDQGSG